MCELSTSERTPGQRSRRCITGNGTEVATDLAPVGRCGNFHPLTLNANIYTISNITPAEFLQKYLELEVYYCDQPNNIEVNRRITTHVSIEVYSNPRYKHANPSEFDLVKGFLNDCQGLHGQSAAIQYESTHRDAIRNCNLGHGAPQHYQIWLSYVLTYGGQGSRRLRRTSFQIRNRLQEYCGRYSESRGDSNDHSPNVAWLGLDCIGFVNRYLMVSGRVPCQINFLGSEGSGIQQLAERSRKRLSVESVQRGDLIIHCSDHLTHIAIVNDRHGNVLDVCESAGSCNGLIRRRWTVISLSPQGVFRFRTDYPNGRGRNEARERVRQNREWGIFASP
ncbi:MAG: hypothetical protein H6936_08185 [Burkholderiales bacterium]|nr:hypothetical protein [Nitrosomonas sp.]MCP5274814.1 hypothetical protein [Burkholderiales bacterium]